MTDFEKKTAGQQDLSVQRQTAGQQVLPAGFTYDHRYDDIIDLPHHKSETRPPMSLYDRAAQFAPFAALTGHEAALAKTLADRQERIAHEYD